MPSKKRPKKLDITTRASDAYLDRVAQKLGDEYDRGERDKIAQAERVCALVIDDLLGGDVGAYASNTPNKRVSLRKLEDRPQIKGKKSWLSKLIRAGLWARTMTPHLSVQERGQYGVDERAKMYSGLRHCPDEIVEIVKNLCEDNLHGEELTTKLKEHAGKTKPNRTHPDRGSLADDLKFLRAAAKRIRTLKESRRNPDSSACTYTFLAEFRNLRNEFGEYLAILDNDVEGVMQAKRKVIAESGADPDEVEASLSQPAREDALNCTSARDVTMDCKLVRRIKRRGSLYPVGPKMGTNYGPTELCRLGCAVGDICYTLTIESVKKLNEAFRAATGLTSIDLTRAWIEKAEALCVTGVPQDGGRDGNQGRDFRINNSGDCHTPIEAAMIGEFARGWIAKGGGVPFGFTRFSLSNPRALFGPAKMIGSCRLHEVPEVLAAGYPAAVVVQDVRAARGALREMGVDVPVYWCPYQARKATSKPKIPCVSCRICTDHKHPLFVVLFVADGDGALVPSENLIRKPPGVIDTTATVVDTPPEPVATDAEANDVYTVVDTQQPAPTRGRMTTTKHEDHSDATPVGEVDPARLGEALAYAENFVFANKAVSPEYALVQAREGALLASDRYALAVLRVPGLPESASFRIGRGDIPPVADFLRRCASKVELLLRPDGLLLKAASQVMPVMCPDATFPRIRYDMGDSDPVQWSVSKQEVLMAIENLLATASSAKEKLRVRLMPDGDSIVLSSIRRTDRPHEARIGVGTVVEDRELLVKKIKDALDPLRRSKLAGMSAFEATRFLHREAKARAERAVDDFSMRGCLLSAAHLANVLAAYDHDNVRFGAVPLGRGGYLRIKNVRSRGDESDVFLTMLAFIREAPR